MNGWGPAAANSTSRHLHVQLVTRNDRVYSKFYPGGLKLPLSDGLKALGAEDLL